MTGIFISYRREDSGPYAGRLFDALVRHFGEDSVFFDVDGISPGEDFREVIQRTGSSCDVMLAVIGRQWTTAQDKNGRIRLSNENDYVRMEVGFALKRGIRVIPVLVGGAEIPEPSALPSDLRDLVFRTAWELSDKRFHQDVQSLVDALKKAPSFGALKPSLPQPPLQAPESTATKKGEPAKSPVPHADRPPLVPPPGAPLAKTIKRELIARAPQKRDPAGAAISTETRGLYILKRIGSELRGPYCYGSDDELTSHFFDIQVASKQLRCRFSWFQSRMQGVVVLRLVSDHELAGGWWLFDKSTLAKIELEQFEDDTPGMVNMHLRKLPMPDPMPAWAADYFNRLPTINK
jgi:hypothetical protein